MTGSQMIGGDEFQRKVIAIQDNLTLVFEIDRDTRADNRLDLAQTPVRFDPVAHDCTDFEECVRHRRDVPDPANSRHPIRPEIVDEPD